MGTGQSMNGQGITIIALSAILSFLAILAVILRFIARSFKTKVYFLDDYLIVLGLILTLGVTTNNIVAVSVAGVGEHEIFHNSGPAKGFPLETELQPQGKVMYALQILHTCAMPVIKASVLTFFARLFPTPRFKVAVHVVLLFIICWWLSTLIVTVFQCNPISFNWGTKPGQLDNCIPKINIFYEIAAFMNMIGDVVVLVLPFPTVVGLQMHSKHKIAVLGMFLTGILVVVAGIGRTVAYFKDHYNDTFDFSYWYYSLVAWTTVEPTLGVISACLPTLRPLFAGMSPESLMGSIRSVLSLHSMRGSSPSSKDRAPPDDRQHLPSSAAHVGATVGCRSQGGFSRLPDPNASSKENQSVAMELSERKNMQKEMPATGIIVQEELDQKVVHATHEMV
ncbi:hypothetical protein ACLMJK_006703 [Lecanora helva]